MSDQDHYAAMAAQAPTPKLKSPLRHAKESSLPQKCGSKREKNIFLENSDEGAKDQGYKSIQKDQSSSFFVYKDKSGREFQVQATPSDGKVSPSGSKFLPDGKNPFQSSSTPSNDANVFAQNSSSNSNVRLPDIKIKDEGGNGNERKRQVLVVDKRAECLLANKKKKRKKLASDLQSKEQFLNHIHNNLTINGVRQEIEMLKMRHEGARKSPDKNSSERRSPREQWTMNTNTQYVTIQTQREDLEQEYPSQQRNNSFQISPPIKSHYTHKFQSLNRKQEQDSGLQKQKETGFKLYMQRMQGKGLKGKMLLSKTQHQVQKPNDSSMEHSVEKDAYGVFPLTGLDVPSQESPAAQNWNTGYRRSFQGQHHNNGAPAALQMQQVGNTGINFGAGALGGLGGKESGKTEENGMSPKLGYKRKKRDYYKQQKNAGQVNANYKLISTHQYQTIQNRIGGVVEKHANPHISFGQMIKTLNQVNHQEVPMSNLETWEEVTRQRQLMQNYNIQHLVKSLSQDIDAVQNPIPQSSQLDELAQNYNLYTKKILQADELLELAQSIKKQRLQESSTDGIVQSATDQLLGTLSIQRIKRQQKINNEAYPLRRKDYETISKYSKKGQNLLSSFEDYIKGGNIITHSSRNPPAAPGPKAESKKSEKPGHLIEAIQVENQMRQSKDESALFIANIQLNGLERRSQIKKETHSFALRQADSNLIQFEQRAETQSAEEDKSADDPKEEEKKFYLPKILKRQAHSTVQEPIDINKFFSQLDDIKNTKVGVQKKKIQVNFPDNNSEFLNHQINKTIQYKRLLTKLAFKTKDHNPQELEILKKSIAFFNIPIPKQFKMDLFGFLKTKEFVSLAKERINQQLSSSMLKLTGLAEPATGQFKYCIGFGNNHQIVKQVLKARQWWVQGEKERFGECHFLWTQWLKEKHIQALTPFGQSANAQDAQEEEEPSETLTKLYNKLEGNWNLSDKKHLFFNMQAYYKSQGVDPFEILPVTFVLEGGDESGEFKRFEDEFRRQSAEGKSIWIVKPGENTNRGTGIIVSSELGEIRQLVNEKAGDSGDRTAIVQKYIENPLLINKRKFDIRCYSLMVAVNGVHAGFFYQDGYFRTSSKEFSVGNLGNRYIHLTNDAIQKHSEDYGKFENANKLSFSDFDRYFEQNGTFDVKFKRDFVPQIRKIVKDTFLAVDGKLDPEKRQNAFEIFGYDFMIDDQFRLNLIEVNTNPCLEICCPLLARIIPNLLDSVFKLALDPLFPPGNKKFYSNMEIINDFKMELVFLGNK